MNILFLDSIGTTVYGGMEEWIRLVAISLAARGHSITVAGRKDSQFLQRMRANKKSVELIELDISGDFNPVTIARLKRIMASRSIEIVSVNFNKDVRLGGIAARLGSSARVVWSVGLDITSDKL
jgi:hypothetical protein